MLTMERGSIPEKNRIKIVAKDLTGIIVASVEVEVTGSKTRDAFFYRLAYREVYKEAIRRILHPVAEEYGLG